MVFYDQAAGQVLLVFVSLMVICSLLCGIIAYVGYSQAVKYLLSCTIYVYDKCSIYLFAVYLEKKG